MTIRRPIDPGLSRQPRTADTARRFRLNSKGRTSKDRHMGQCSGRSPTDLPVGSRNLHAMLTRVASLKTPSEVGVAMRLLLARSYPFRSNRFRVGGNRFGKGDLS
jgi:hypothetical protein